MTIDAFLSPLLNWRYSPNYDVGQEMDRALVLLMAEMDLQMVSRGMLKPTALFGIFAPNPAYESR